MINPTMTYAEFKERVAEHNASDSISKRKEIEEKIQYNATAVLERVNLIHTELGYSFVPPSDFRLRLEPDGSIGDKTVMLEFDDYRPSDDLDEVVKKRIVNVDMKLLDESELDAYVDEFLENKVQTYEFEIDRVNGEIDSMKKMIVELKERIENRKSKVGKGWREIVGLKKEKEGENGAEGK